MLIRKRNGEDVEFNVQKIVDAIERANGSVSEANRLPHDQVAEIANTIRYRCENLGHIPQVEEVQDMVIRYIQKYGAFDLATSYTIYRYQRQLARGGNTIDKKVLAILEGTNEEARTENSNKNIDIAPVQRDYIAGEVNRDLTERILLPKDIVEEHRRGSIHFHDGDFFGMKIHNCCLVNLDDMLQHGTVITDTMIEKPHTFATACNIATQIVMQVASCQYGGQTFSLAHLAPFVDISRNKIRADLIAENDDAGTVMTDEQIEKHVASRLKREISAGVQTIQYQLLTMMTTNGQTPFVSVVAYLNEADSVARVNGLDAKRLRTDLAMVIEEVLNQRYDGIKNKAGVKISPPFPKILYFLEEDNCGPDREYWYLTKLAAKCSNKRLTPDYISEKQMLLQKINGVGMRESYPCMGCRAFLTPDRMIGTDVGNVANAGNYEPDHGKYYGRFNQGVVTINLPYAAMESGGDIEKFWKIFDERLELCHRALQIRHKRLLGTTSDVAPIMWQYGALARLAPGEKIDKLLYGGYSTISLGYAGLYECVKFLTGESHTEEKVGRPLAVKIMQHMNDRCAEWKKAENIDYSVYGTPIESTTYKFAKALQRDFGIVPDVSDHGYITNSYHVNVRENISAFDKLAFEAEFQKLSPGGQISYVEIPNMDNNLDAVEDIIMYMYDNIMYAELNTKSDYCHVCGFDGEILIKEENGKLIWECPRCGNRDQKKMDVSRRTCGYIGTKWWNQGRTEEIRDRVLHVSIPEVGDPNG